MQLDHFIELELALVVLLQSRPEMLYVDESHFREFEDCYPLYTVKKFFETLSQRPQGIRSYLLEARMLHSPELRLELAESSPLIDYPLLRIGQRYYIYSTTLLYRSLEERIYRLLRDLSPQTFKELFGTHILEPYVERSIKETGLQYVTEKQLQSHLPKTRCVDYIMVDDEVNVLVDSKAVEATYIGEASDDSNDILPRISSSVLRAIDQAFKMMNNLRGGDEVAGVSLGKSKEAYLLIVTYKDLVLGSGANLYYCLACNAIDPMIQMHGGKAPIPLEHIYVLSVEDFDLLAQAVGSGKTDLADALRKVVAADSKPIQEGKRMIFRQHLQDLVDNLRMPPFIETEFLSMAERIKDMLS